MPPAKKRRVITVTGDTYAAVNKLKGDLNQANGRVPKWTLSDVIARGLSLSEARMMKEARK
jgi:hypothetical protein